MPDATPDVVTALATVTASGQGLGAPLRILLVASMVGAALLAWFLLRGYRSNGGDDNHND
ncbi:hypothetical protein ACGFW5_00355 [Streptomyces sp. NPDC048416]|uniref:hypothetical protein n=1 Tax=Streptomyces sp. NPDC048416 TaxID=3365546 RepID=UPI00372288DE